MAYELALPTHIKVHNVFHAYLLMKYVYDTKHVIDWSLLQVELEGYNGQERGAAQEVHHSSVESAMEEL